jgi:hypothetical protein
MKTNYISSTDTNNNYNNEYKICAGKNCNNLGKYHLKVLFINRSGWFCDYCKEELTSLRLIKENE